MRVVRIILHPDGTRRIVILRRDDGLYSYEEQVHRDAPDDPDQWQWLEAAREGGRVWFRHAWKRSGLYGTADDAEQDALRALVGYRFLH